MNNRAYELLQNSAPLRMDQSQLVTDNRHQTKKLHQLIHKQAYGLGGKQLSTGHIIPSSTGEPPVSLWVSPAPELPGDAEFDEPRVAIYLASRPLRLSISAESLSTMYNLTPSEIKLVQCLANGSHNVRDAAEAAGISYETARSYLKIILQKTDTHSLPELLKLLLTSPAALVGETQQFKAITEFSPPHGSYKPHSSITLNDGRKLAYAEYGDPKGSPVLYFHSMTGGRLECDHDQEILFHKRIRLIAPDRPGFGASTRKEGRNALDWVDDILELTEQLGIDSFGLLSFASGGPYGLACCCIMPEKISHLCMISPPGLCPDHETIQQCGTLPVHRIALRIAIRMPGLLSQTVRMIYKLFMRNIDQYWQRIYPHICENNRQQIEKHRNLLKTAFLDGGQQGSSEIARELKLFVSPWGFDASRIHTPITVWHGKKDRHAPISLSHAMIEKLQHAELIQVDDEGFI